MSTEMPLITKRFVKEIQQNSKKGSYTKTINDKKIIRLQVDPFVFPPQSNFTNSAKTAIALIKRFYGKKVLDVGTGTGILAMNAILNGADRVDAIDILPEAVECAKKNIIQNDFGEKIKVFESDLFSSINKNERYDVIIANLPIVDFTVKEKWQVSLLDPNFETTRRFFAEAKNYLKKNGKIVYAHSTFGNPKEIEKIIKENGYKIINKETQTMIEFGEEFFSYEIIVGDDVD